MTVRQATAGAALLALVLTGCSSSPENEVRDGVSAVLDAANDRDVEATDAAVDELLAILRAQVGSGELSRERAAPVQDAARAVQESLDELEPEPSPSPTPPKPSPSPSPSPEPEPSPSPEPEPSPTPEPEPSPTDEPEQPQETDEPDEPTETETETEPPEDDGQESAAVTPAPALPAPVTPAPASPAPAA